MSARAARAIVIVAALAGCRGAPSGGAPAGSTSASPLGASVALGGEVARVGDVSIPPSLVVAVARAQGLSAEQATRVLVDEALLAEAAVREGALRDPGVRRRIEAADARTIVDRDREATLAEGPFTDAEIDAAMGDEWIELDRPETRTVEHALVPKDVKDGAAIVRALHDRLAGAKDGKAFLDEAKAFGAERGVAIVAEPIDQPFTKDGRFPVRGATTTLDKTFAAAAFAIPKVGDEGDVVETPFGWHVIRLASIEPGNHATRAEKLATLAPVMIKNRAQAAFEAKLARLRKDAGVVRTASSADLATPRFEAPEPR